MYSSKLFFFTPLLAPLTLVTGAPLEGPSSVITLGPTNAPGPANATTMAPMTMMTSVTARPTILVSELPLVSAPPLPTAVNAAAVEADTSDNSNVTISSDNPDAIGLAVAEDTPMNQLDMGMCITPFKVAAGITAGMYFRFTDVSVNKTEYLDFKASGPQLYVLYQFFKSHTNADGFWQDNNVIVRAGANVGYHPTNKHFNLAGMNPAQELNEAEIKAVCKDIFGMVTTDVQSGAFGRSYIGGDLPNLLNPE